MDFDHVAFIKDSDDWPVWPRLPVKRHSDENEGGWPDMGLVFAGNLCEVHKGANLFGTYNPEEVEIIKYDSVEALVADGWRVD